MEGSWHFKDVENYSFLAAYYDELLQDEESLEYWLNYIEKLEGKKVLELASGSGLMASILASKGYDVIASDLSPQMREVALKTNFSGDYRIINMIDFNLEDEFDIILCLCDSINHLEKDELDSMFANVYKHLRKGGTFLFDMHSVKRLEEFKEEYIEEGQVRDTNYQWSILADDYNKQIMERFTFYFDDGIVQEHHVQNVFTIAEVEEKMKQNGFNVESIENFIPDEKVLLMGVKE